MLSADHVASAVKPLRMIFWGGVLWIFDVTFTSGGFRLDLLDDTVGVLLIAAALFRLARAPVPGRYHPIMSFLRVVAVASLFSTAVKHFTFDYPAPLSFLLAVISLAQLVATVLFCAAMKMFCDHAALPQVARSWHVTLLLFGLIYTLPLGLFYAAGLVALATGTQLHLSLGLWALLLLPIFVAPLIHLFVSTSRMRRAAASTLHAAAAAD